MEDFVYNCYTRFTEKNIRLRSSYINLLNKNCEDGWRTSSGANTEDIEQIDKIKAAFLRNEDLKELLQEECKDKSEFHSAVKKQKWVTFEKDTSVDEDKKDR